VGEPPTEPGQSEPGESDESRQPAINKAENSADYRHLKKFQISPISQYENHCDNWLAPDSQGRESAILQGSLAQSSDKYGQHKAGAALAIKGGSKNSKPY
jgi:hypothetical protein